MEIQIIFALLFTLMVTNGCIAQLTDDKDLLLNWCLNATLHKEKPGKEDSLHEQCLPWKDHACCTEKTARQIHEEDMHNFNLDHCYERTGRNLTDKCRQYFDRDNCFYECEPHIGLWVVKTNRRIATERFLNVPLCASDCDAWWEACKDDLTCVFNWPRNFKFRNGVNYCPEDHGCQTFQAIYGDAQTFCENVWDHSWNYTADSEPCMRMWFNGTAGNPNRNTAEYYIKLRFGGASISTASYFLIALTMAIAVHASHYIS